MLDGYVMHEDPSVDPLKREIPVWWERHEGWQPGTHSGGGGCLHEERKGGRKKVESEMVTSPARAPARSGQSASRGGGGRMGLGAAQGAALRRRMFLLISGFKEETNPSAKWRIATALLSPYATRPPRSR